MNDYNLSILYNRCPSYFSQLKLNNPEKYDFIFSFDKNRVNSLKKYFLFVEKIVNKISYILNFYDNSDYGKFLKEIGLINHLNFKNVFEKECFFIFRIRNDEDYFDFSVYQIQKYSKTIEAFQEKYKIIL